MTEYLDALIREIEARSGAYAAVYAKKPQADTVYIGGGTPSVLHQGVLPRILHKIRGCFAITSDAEITIESNPESCSEAFLAECVLNGVNRISLGLQSHDDAVLKGIGRPHVYADFTAAVQRIEKAGICNVSADIMSGLPNQTADSVLESLKRVTNMPAVKHISLYALTVEEGTPLYRSGFRPDEDLQADLYEQSVRFLANAGFMRYEVSNFAKPGFTSRHNGKYWSGEPYMGFGAAAHSFLPDVGAPQIAFPSVRIENHADISRYCAGDFEIKREIVTPDERVTEIVMLSLRTAAGLDTARLYAETGYDILAKKAAAVRELTELGMISVQNGKIAVQDRGFYLLNTIILKLL